MKLTAEQRIEKAHVSLMQNKDFCLFSGLFMVGKVTVSDTCPTAKTDGRDVTYGRAFVESLNDKELKFLVVHEAMHKAYRHLTTWKHLPNKRLANVAMDFVINLQIQDTDPYESEVAMPRDKDTGERIGCLDEQYRGLDTQQVYTLLEKQGKGKGGKGNGKGKGGEYGKPCKGDGDEPGSGQPDSASDSPNDDGGLDDHDWDGANKLSDKEAEELGREVDAALREGSMLAGRLKGKVMRGVTDILHPQVRWEEVLRDFVKRAVKGGDQSTWRRPNRRYLGVDIVMPTSQSLRTECIALGTDTSGSIAGDILGRFLGEMQSIADEVTPEKIELMYWDTAVASRETYVDGAVALLSKSTKPKGGGGTNPDCVPKFMKENRIDAQCLIMLTDGYFYGHDAQEWAGLSTPVLWCVVGNRDFHPAVGQIVHVE
jgi:predicted metal-dependent peptidase